MARRAMEIVRASEAPLSLEGHPFFGLHLDENQKKFRDSIWDKEKLIIFCDAVAGTGKTVIATATAELLVRYGLYSEITYIAAPTQEQKQGYLPGDIDRKSEPYFSPFYQALRKININTNVCMTDDVNNLKNGTGYISCQTHTFLRGTNFENQVIIIDEMQNFTTTEVKKVLTRIHDNCKVICIGHSKQIDLRDENTSGFARYIEHFRVDSRAAVCELTKNYRGWISSWADSIA